MTGQYYLVHVLKHQEQVHLSAHLHPLAVANIKQSEKIEKIFDFFLKVKTGFLNVEIMHYGTGTLMTL